MRGAGDVNRRSALVRRFLHLLPTRTVAAEQWCGGVEEECARSGLTQDEDDLRCRCVPHQDLKTCPVIPSVARDLLLPVMKQIPRCARDDIGVAEGIGVVEGFLA